MTKIKYFHELSQSELDNLLIHKDDNFIFENYLQPDWCKMNEALNYGCSALIELTFYSKVKISKDYCKKCKYFK